MLKGSFVPSGALTLAVQSHNSFGISLQALLWWLWLLEKDPGVPGFSWFFSHWRQLDGSAGVASALPISDPLAQIALGNAALSLLLRLNTHTGFSS